jgi:hypothetical protein
MASETKGRSFVSIGNEHQDFFSSLLDRQGRLPRAGRLRLPEKTAQLKQLEAQQLGTFSVEFVSSKSTQLTQRGKLLN